VSTSNLYRDGNGASDGAVATVFDCLLCGATGLVAVTALCTLFSTFPADTDRVLVRGGATSLLVLDCIFCSWSRDWLRFNIWLKDPDFFRVRVCMLELDLCFEEPSLNLSKTLFVRLRRGDSVVGDVAVAVASCDWRNDGDEGDRDVAVIGGFVGGLLSGGGVGLGGSLVSFCIVTSSRMSFSKRSLISASCVLELISKSFWQRSSIASWRASSSETCRSLSRSSLLPTRNTVVFDNAEPFAARICWCSCLMCWNDLRLLMAYNRMNASPVWHRICSPAGWAGITSNVNV